MNVVGPTLAVLTSWLVVGAVLAGCGALVARAAAALVPLEAPRRLAACVWLGYAAVVAYLQLWNLLAPISWLAWLAPLLAAVAGGLGARPRLPAGRPGRRALLVGAPLALAALWFANQTLGQTGDYDLGLYHLDVIRYAEKYATIPGLGNLHLRLGAGDAHLLFAAFLDHGPWAGVGYRLGDGLLAVLLLFEVGSRLAAPPHGGGPSFTRRVAVLLVPATVVLAGIAPSVRITSPNLDLAAFVLVSVGMLYLADCVENGVRPLEACTAVAMLCVASATRPLYWLAAAAALAIVALQLRGAARAGAFALRRALGAVCAFPALLFLGWTVRQTILTGYPFFPLTIGGLPVNWRVPAAAVTAESRLDGAWARWPDMPINVVFSSWRWLWAEWFKWEKIDLAVTAPLMLCAGLAPALLGSADPGRRSRLRPMLALVLLSLPTLVIWFQEAPDPRFAWAPIWLVAIALVAWALPPGGAPLALGLAGAGSGVVLTLVFVHHFVWLLPATLALWGYVWLLVLMLRRRRWQAFVAHAAVVSAVVAMLGVLVDRDAYAVVHANHSGPFGTPLLPPTAVRTARSATGLRFFMPVATDQCFGVLLCTPQPSSDRIHLRGRGLGSGFSVDP